MKRIVPSAIIFTSVALLCIQNARAQVAALPFTASLDTFVEITGTTLDAMGADDVLYSNLDIGFDFSLGGTIHSKLTVSTNGYIELDSVSSSMLTYPLSGSRNNIVSPFGGDLIHNSVNASLQYITLGTAPDRICIVQWLHYAYFGGIGDINFQVWFYETSNCIRFVYGANTLLTYPLQTQIGLRGTTDSDYAALGDTSCNWASAYPYPSLSTTFPVSMYCSMPSGFSFHFGACANNGGLNFAYITGKVFSDVNGNGTLDGGENGLANHIIHIMPGNYYVSSYLNGDYSFFFFDSAQTYSLTSAPQQYWIQTTPATLTVDPLSQSCSGNNIGFQMIPNVHEVSISTPNWGAKPAQAEPMPISYWNDGTVTESDTITFVMDSLYSFISSSPDPAYISGQTIKWLYPDLEVGCSGYISLYLMPSADAVLGNYLNSTLTMNPLNDTVPGNNVVNLHQLITNAWDPNEKSAYPAGMITSGTEINYTIHFQNTGNSFADNIVVKDTLDSNLDPMTFRLTGSSHPFNFAMSGNGIATFTFYNIQLPDSGTNFEASNGWVSYAIKTLNGLLPLTVINNTAGIYFDYNPAVMTNNVADTISVATGTGEAGIKTFYLNASPNPSSGGVVIYFSNDVKEKAKLSISSVDGTEMMCMKNISSSQAIDVSKLPSGIYICILQSASGEHFVKLVKE